MSRIFRLPRVCANGECYVSISDSPWGAKNLPAAALELTELSCYNAASCPAGHSYAYGE